MEPAASPAPTPAPEAPLVLHPLRATDAELEYARQLVLQGFYNPDDARFGNLGLYAYGENGAWHRVVCGYVNGQSRAGGYVGYKPFAALLDRQRAVAASWGSDVTSIDDLLDGGMVARYCPAYARDLTPQGTAVRRGPPSSATLGILGGAGNTQDTPSLTAAEIAPLVSRLFLRPPALGRASIPVAFGGSVYSCMWTRGQHAETEPSVVRRVVLNLSRRTAFLVPLPTDTWASSAPGATVSRLAASVCPPTAPVHPREAY